MIVRQDADVYKRVILGEKIDLKELFDFLIYRRKGVELDVVSTNYDKIAEYAVSQSDAYLNMGFSMNYFGQIKSNLMLALFVNIWKVHGSLYWFKKTI